ncbi:hypothetical protein J7K44_01420 [bacterium]|nr:hypothetical protein [bacterium]
MLFLKRVKSFFLLPKRELNWWVFNWRNSKEFKRQLFAVVLGFGIGGMLWGWQCYDWTTSHNEAFTNPFSIILGALWISIFGGLALAFSFLREKKKKFLLLFFLGIPAWFLAFLIPGIFSSWLWYGSLIFLHPFVLFFFLLFDSNKIVSLFDLDPSLHIGTLCLEFFFSFLLIAVFYSFFFKKPSKLKLIFIPPIWVGIFAIISPIIGNLIGVYLFHSLLLSYLLTFLLISLSFALSLFKEIKYET